MNVEPHCLHLFALCTHAEWVNASKQQPILQQQSVPVAQRSSKQMFNFKLDLTLSYSPVPAKFLRL